jgi:exopolysaccharide biosynthesis polyprenyl glycosylphosphotransferase
MNPIAAELSGTPATEETLEEGGQPPFAPYDVRLRRELAHRRMVLAYARRFVRVSTLHVLDATVLVGSVALVALVFGGAAVSREFLPVTVAIFLLSLNALSSYGPADARMDLGRIATGLGLAIATLSFLVVFPPYLPYELTHLAVLGAVAFVGLAAERTAADRVVRHAYARGIGLRKALVIGSLSEAGHAISRMRDDHNVNQFVVGHVDPRGGDPTSLGSFHEVDSLLRRHEIQEVIVASSLSSAKLNSLARLCFESGAALFVIPSVVGRMMFPAEPLQVGDCPLLRLHPPRFEFPALMVKRLIDIAFSLFAGILAAPLILLIALAIKLDSRGAVFYQSPRIGLGGRPFNMWKFRSMSADAAAQEQDLLHMNIYQGGTFKIRQDPRITRVGRLLRRTSLDELPQLLNVLKGEMSIVGPRPALVADIERYAPHHFERLHVVPGITGPWQVSGRNLVTDFEEIIEMERRYIRSWSLWVDVRILVRTLGVVIRGEGAY